MAILTIFRSDDEIGGARVLAVVVVLSVSVILIGVAETSSGTPARVIAKLANNTVCEVVATYNDPADVKSYVIVRTLDGSLLFIKTDVPHNVGYYKLKISGYGYGRTVEWIPFSTVLTTETK